MNCAYCGDAAVNDVPGCGDGEVDYTTCEYCRRVIPLEAARCYVRTDEADMDFGRESGE